MTVQEAITAAEQLLPGRAAPDGEEDARWQATSAIGQFLENQPEAVWPFVLRWGSHEDADVRAAIATCLLEHLLEYHFDLIFPRVEAAARANLWFSKTTSSAGNLDRRKIQSEPSVLIVSAPKFVSRLAEREGISGHFAGDALLKSGFDGLHTASNHRLM